MKTLSTLVLLGAFALGSSACASVPDTSSLPVAEYAGHLVTQEQGNWFEPCGAPAGERWWVTFTERSVPQIAEARARGVATADVRAFVRWRAARTDERHVGPGGPALLVREVLEVRAAEDADCSLR